MWYNKYSILRLFPSWKGAAQKEIQKDLDDGIDPIGKKMTVCQLYAKQIRHRLMKLLEDDPLGARPIESVKLSDAKEWALRMRDRGIAYRTISNDKRSLKAAFYTAMQDDCIRKNPFDFQLNKGCFRVYCSGGKEFVLWER